MQDYAIAVSEFRHCGLDPQSKHHCISMTSGLRRCARNDERGVIQSFLKHSPELLSWLSRQR